MDRRAGGAGRSGWLGLDANLTTDGVRDLLNARECMQGLTCVEKGTSASVGNLTHGTIWTRFLIAVDVLGLTPYQQALVMLVAFALAAGLVYAYAARNTQDAVGLWTSIFFVVLVGASGFPEFSNEYLGLLPQALYYYAVTRMIEAGGYRWTLMAGLSLFCCMDAHVSFLALTPIFLWAAAIAPGNTAGSSRWPCAAWSYRRGASPRSNTCRISGRIQAPGRGLRRGRWPRARRACQSIVVVAEIGPHPPGQRSPSAASCGLRESGSWLRSFAAGS